MLEFLGIVFLLLLIGVSIALHEVGHLLPAKKFGVKVTEFAIGFGPALWKGQWGETSLRLRALPIGGFIRMIGMYPPSRQDGKRVGGWFAQQVLDARELSASEIADGDDSRTFYRLPTAKRLAVMVGGPSMNLLFAAVLFAISLSVIGVETASNQVAEVVTCIPTISDPEGDDPGCAATPAAAAKIAVGERVIAINSVETADWQAVRTQLAKFESGETLNLALRSENGDTRVLSLTLADLEYEVLDQNGKPTGEVQHRAFVGLSPAAEYVRMPITAVPGVLWNLTTASVEALGRFPVMVADLAVRLATGQERDPAGPISVVGVTVIGGEIAASDLAWQSKLFNLLAMAGSLNLFLFLFNLVPLLPLDGGHASAAVFESLRRRWAKWRNRPDPGPVDVARLLPLSYVTTLLLLASGLLVIVADIFAPISLQG